MNHRSNVRTKVIWLRSILNLRVKVVIVGLVGGGVIFAFPAASAGVLAYLALMLATVGIMAWTGMLAPAAAAPAVLIIPASEARGSFPRDEKYPGGVVQEKDGGCVRPNRRVAGIAN